jgi:MYXO-CTERM domain-containing protein
MDRIASLAAHALLTVPVTANAYFVESVYHADGGAEVLVKYDTTEPVEFRAGPSTYPEGVDATASIAAAFETWTNVECASIAFTQGADEAMPMARHWTRPGATRYIPVYFSNDPALFASELVGFFEWAQDTLGEMIGGQIILNSLHHSWSTTGEAGKLDVQSIVTALAGRVLGITSNMEGNATYPRYAPGDTSKRELGADDIAALQYIYLEDGCDAPVDPEMICNPMSIDCPPPVMTMPSDGGTIDPRDSGPPAGTDSGGPMLTDGGSTPPGGDDDGGCCSVAAGASSGNERGAWLAMGVLALLLGGRLRRRK